MVILSKMNYLYQSVFKAFSPKTSTSGNVAMFAISEEHKKAGTSQGDRYDKGVGADGSLIP